MSAKGSENGPGGRHLPRRLLQLYAGLTAYGVSMGLMVRAGLGLEPWSVLNQGISEHTGLTIGTVTIVSGALILLLWVPLRQRVGLGTVSNVILLGLVMDGTMALVPAYSAPAVRIPMLALAVTLNGAATGLYLSARFGPGPRDGLMTGLHLRTGRPIRLVRTCIEVTVLAAGFALGGSVGVGTVVYALAIGPMAQFFLRIFAIKGLEEPSRVVAGKSAPEQAPAAPEERPTARETAPGCGS
ncbi:YczE/YyaS/YitT family protein [Streptomyces sclerotialus]|uniref:membrane protein YczE n=1 Tax=Streptomyces sclerotialus TaxID=1957 RepID=UPI00068FC1E1